MGGFQKAYFTLDILVFILIIHSVDLYYKFIPLICCVRQTALLKSGPPQHDIHYWLGNDVNEVCYGFCSIV